MSRRAAYGREVATVLWIVLVLNLAVAVAKLVVGVAIRSLTLIGDAVHSSIDALNNVVGLVAVRWATREADAGHPYGHSKFETLAAFVLSGLLFVTAFEIARAAVPRLLASDPVEPRVGGTAFAVALGTLVVNLLVARWEGRRGQALGSDFLIADAAHTRSDVLVTATVIASLVCARLGIRRVDAALALVVAGLVGRIGWNVSRRTLPVLVDASAVDEARVHEIVGGVPGVLSAHAVRSRRAGERVFVDMHLVVEPTDTTAAHAVTEAVERALESALGPTSATIHVETQRDCGQ